MNKEKFNSLLEQPSSINSELMDELTYLNNEFPYCQSSHILLTLGHYINNSIKFESKLKTTAIYVGSRKVLKQHIDRLNEYSLSLYFYDEGVKESSEKKSEAEKVKTNESKETSSPNVAEKEVISEEIINKEKIKIEVIFIINKLYFLIFYRII